MIYNHKLINDLAWAIGSPALVAQSPYNDERIVTSSWSKQQLKRAEDLLLLQDKSPQLIQTYLSNMPTFKLGVYFENLIAYWFEISPDYEILHKNLVVSDESKTIGEFDLIIRDMRKNKVIHVEVAVKFFLQVNDSEKSHWLGPNLIDSLDLKYDKLINKQIEFSNHEIAKRQLDKLDLEINEHWIILKGRMFREYSGSIENNSWLTLADFEGHIEAVEAQWVKLDKTHWLAEISNLDYNFLPNEVFTKSQLIDALTTNVIERPVCIAKVIEDTEVGRFFITPNDWYQRALSSLS